MNARPTERRRRSYFPQPPRGAHPCREACMPPLQTPGSAYTNRGTGGGGRFTGRIHAAPTNRPGTAGRRAKQAFAADRHGGVKTPPYRAAYTVDFPANPARGTPHNNGFRFATAFGPCVGAATMPPAKRCPRRPFMVCAVFISHCRGRMYAAREHCGIARCRAGMVFTPHCRAGS